MAVTNLTLGSHGRYKNSDNDDDGYDDYGSNSTVLALCTLFFPSRMISDRLFLQKYVSDVFMFCFIFVSRLILWILKGLCSFMTFVVKK